MNLYQASCWYFKRSQSALKASLVLSLVLLGLTLLALKPSSNLEDAILIVLIAAFQLWQMWLKYRASYWFAKGDEPRRMNQLKNGLGLPPSAEKCAAIEQETGKCEEPINPNYWASRKPQGPVRMVEMLLESSFYTRFLAIECRNLFWGIASAGLTVAIVALIVAARLADARKDELVIHVVLAVFVFFLTGDLWNLGFLYNDLSKAADEAHKSAHRLLQTAKIDFDTALELALDYNTAVVQAPPLLSGTYFKSNKKLDEIFARNYSRLLGL